MVDFFFVTSLINMIWQIFSILFVLYRFTSFFSLVYNFIKFLGKLFQGLVYIKEQIIIYFKKKNGYSVLNEDEMNGIQGSKSFIQTMYDWVFGKKQVVNDRLPLYETRTSLYDNMNSHSDIDFENHMQNMMDPNYDSAEFYKMPKPKYPNSYYKNIINFEDEELPRENKEISVNTEINVNIKNDNTIDNNKKDNMIDNTIDNTIDNNKKDNMIDNNKNDNNNEMIDENFKQSLLGSGDDTF